MDLSSTKKFSSEKAFDLLLSKFREQRSEREKGTAFENMCKVFFKYDALHSSRFSKVETYAEWAESQNESKLDTGIDLVATIKNEDNKYCAIQCKFYKEGEVLNTKLFLTFLVATHKDKFVERIIVDTTDKDFSAPLQKNLHQQSTPVLRVTLSNLRSCNIDWNEYLLSNEKKVVQQKKDKLRPYQEVAVKNTIEGFQKINRGKLLMACGTGKTFTSLKIAEKLHQLNMTNDVVLYLVPSLALMSQVIRDWSNDSKEPFYFFAVCSDSEVGKYKKEEDNFKLNDYDLEIAATTSAKKLADNVKKIKSKDGVKVIFSTYQSITTIIEAQKDLNLSEIGLTICDEAHRTAGSTDKDEEMSNFQKVHKDELLKSKKRLYMTATPKIYGDKAKTSAKYYGAELSSMDDIDTFGEVFYELSFSDAVNKNILSDYKVMILTTDPLEGSTNNVYKTESGEINADIASKIIGCYKCITKMDFNENKKTIMQRSLAFCNSVDISENFVTPLFNEVIEKYISDYKSIKRDELPTCEVKHIDGADGAKKRNEVLDWLRDYNDNNICKILSNVRCLTEGVDVPSLDSVIFFHPRKSEVDVVQAVGRVMRKTDEKNLGFIIIPVVLHPDSSTDSTLNRNSYKVIWQILNALRAHDKRLEGEINSIDIGEEVRHTEDGMPITNVGKRIEIISVIEKYSKRSQTKNPKHQSEKPSKKFKQAKAQTSFDFSYHNAIVSKIVENCGSRIYWEDWAKDVAEIATKLISIINAKVDGKAKSEFNQFLKELRESINGSVTKEDAIEMLAQHVITMPIFDALFNNTSYKFTQNNPMSKALDKVLKLINNDSFEDNKNLTKFYDSVKMRIIELKTAKAKQNLMIELYDKFFRRAFPLLTQKLGIVYTPIEIVDFLLSSVEIILKEEFGLKIDSKNVNILDPFTGTGTFITRLIQSGLISKRNLDYKFSNDIHANELLLLAYYIANINIENAYYDITNKYMNFRGICLTDTFEYLKSNNMTDSLLIENSQRKINQTNKNIEIIIGNPPYSIGQKTANDDAKNLVYEKIDRSIENTYKAESNADNVRSLNDTYIRAIRWATNLIDAQDNKSGIIAFVNNAGWLNISSADGMRKCIENEFSKIYIFNLKGNIRKYNKEEGENVFGNANMLPIAINIFVKKAKPNKKKCEIKYFETPFFTKEDKLNNISELKNINSIKNWNIIKPNDQNDWLNQRSQVFKKYIAMHNRNKGLNLFNISSFGVTTNRDGIVYNSSKIKLYKIIEKFVTDYNYIATKYSKSIIKLSDLEPEDKEKIKWSRGLIKQLNNKKSIEVTNQFFVIGTYRPFNKQWMYFDRNIIEDVCQQPNFFPINNTRNLAILTSGKGNSGFATIMVDNCPNLNILEAGAKAFPISYLEGNNNLISDKSIYYADSIFNH